MKRLFFTFFAICFCIVVSAEIRMGVCFDGYWSNWYTPVRSGSSILKAQGSYAGFVLYLEKDGPWEATFKLSIDNFQMPGIKIHKDSEAKKDKWYEYTGTVEYYICDKYPSIYESFKKGKGPNLIPPTLDNGMPTKKMTSKAKIWINAKDHKLYNIWFDNVGLGIDFNDINLKKMTENEKE